METKLDQTSIPPPCRNLSEMAHTRVGKVVPLQLKGHEFNPQWYSKMMSAMEWSPVGAVVLEPPPN